MKNIESIIAFRGTPQCKIAKYQMEGEEEITTSQSSASMQVFAAVRDAFRIKNGIKWEKFPPGKAPPLPQYGNFFDEIPFFSEDVPKPKIFKIVKYVF